MIPLGLKETKEIELRDSFKDFILEHYRFAKWNEKLYLSANQTENNHCSEDGNFYENQLAELMDLRQAVRNTFVKNTINTTSVKTTNNNINSTPIIAFT